MQVVEALRCLLPIDGVIGRHPPCDINWKIVGREPFAPVGECFGVRTVVGEGGDGFKICP